MEPATKAAEAIVATMQLKRDGRLEEALALCYKAIEAAEGNAGGREPAPWYTEQAAIVHRKLSQADEEWWHQRLEELKAYRAAGNKWPRHKAVITGKEHDLGIWLHSQRMKHRRGQLDGGKEDALDAAVLGWRTGKRRGRRPVTEARPAPE